MQRQVVMVAAPMEVVDMAVEAPPEVEAEAEVDLAVVTAAVAAAV